MNIIKTHNKCIKNVRSHSLGLLKEALCFSLKSPLCQSLYFKTMKMSSNLRAAKQLENIGKYSGAISCLEEFLSVNPNYENKENISAKIKSLKEKFNNEGDSKIQFNFKPLLEIPKSILEFLFETILGWLLISTILGVIYFASTNI